MHLIVAPILFRCTHDIYALALGLAKEMNVFQTIKISPGYTSAYQMEGKICVNNCVSNPIVKPMEMTHFV